MLPPLRSKRPGHSSPEGVDDLGGRPPGRRSDRPASRGGGEHRFVHFERAVEDVTRDRVPFYEEEDEWYYEREMRKMRERASEGRRPSRVEPQPEPEPVLSETVLRVLVGDLAPQVSGALNFISGSQPARTVATLGAAAAVGLVLPKVLK